FLAEVSSDLASALDTDAPLQRVAQRAVPEMADVCMIDVTAEDGPIRCVAAAVADPARMALSDALVGRTRDRTASPRTTRALNVGDPVLFAEVGADDLAEIAG